MERDSTTEKRDVARCGIYEQRPQVCKDYPKIDHYLLEECTFTFIGHEKRGECACGIGACCNSPRENGEPGGTPLPSLAGGKPCKHLVWKKAEMPVEKVASVPLGTTVPALSCPLCALVGGYRDS